MDGRKNCQPYCHSTREIHIQIAVSDFMRAVQEQIQPWVPNKFMALGTDGFGLSDTRGALRRHFKVDAQSIAVAVLNQLASDGQIKSKIVKEAIA